MHLASGNWVIQSQTYIISRSYIISCCRNIVHWKYICISHSIHMGKAKASAAIPPPTQPTWLCVERGVCGHREVSFRCFFIFTRNYGECLFSYIYFVGFHFHQFFHHVRKLICEHLDGSCCCCWSICWPIGASHFEETQHYTSWFTLRWLENNTWKT